MKSEEMDCLSYYAGGVPSGILFRLSFDDISGLIKAAKEDTGSNTIIEVCIIALVAYFEAFCKNQFAAIVNICPMVLSKFCEKRMDTTIKVKDLLSADFYSPNKLGFILSERYDFGSAKSINNLYKDLLLITPFSKDEALKYDRLLNDRNLLVHHAGIYTIKYGEKTFKNHFTMKPQRSRTYYDSLVISKRDFFVWAEFLEGIIVKTLNSSYSALSEFIKKEKIKLSAESIKALEMMTMYMP